MIQKYILSFDCGTTAVKAVLINFEGKVICNAKAEYSLIQLHPGWAEQNPEELWKAICKTSQNVITKASIKPDQIIGLIYAAPWKNIIPIDANGNVLRNSLIWMDARASAQAERLNQAAGFFVGTGQEYWPRLMWVKENEPEIWENAKVIMGLNTYFKWKTTGQIATEPSDDFFHSCNPSIQSDYDKIIHAAGLDKDLDKFPPMKLATEEVGKVTIQAAEEMGLVQGIPVFGGVGDLPAITIGTGCCQENMVHIYFGTSSWLVDIIRNREDIEAPQYFTFNSQYEGGLFALQTGCFAFDWAVEQFYHSERQILGGEVFDFVNKDIAGIPAGSDNLIATHWLNGELPPLSKNAKSVFFNVTSNHDRRHLVHAVMESICYTHRRYLEHYEKAAGKKLHSIRVVGGGAVSDLWMQMLSDVLQITVEVPESPRYTGAMGTYYCAMVGLGYIKDYNAVYDTVKIQRVFKPRNENAEIYDKLYKIYLELHPALHNLYGSINGVY